MRKPTTIEWLYLDFDGFFASVEQQARPSLRGKPVGIVPFDGTIHTCVIACSKEAKAMGVKNVMRLRDAKQLCPELILVPQSPDLYRRAHNALIAEINSVIPITAIKSIDELCCKLQKKDILAPNDLAEKIKAAISEGVGKYVTCSIGFAANRNLAKLACKIDKPNGTTIWSPDILPTPLYKVTFDDVSGIGSRMQKRLSDLGIHDVKSFMAIEPKHARKIWGNVHGEKLWYSLHGYDVKADKSKRGMFGHGRVLPPELRTFEGAYDCSRILIVKAARRMRREKFYAGTAHLWLSLIGPQKKSEYSWATTYKLHSANDDKACLNALDAAWTTARQEVPKKYRVVRVGVTLGELSTADTRQLDFLLNDDPERQKWEKITKAIDGLNAQYGKSLVTTGPWAPPAGGNLGGKISFTRIPRAEDFW